VAPRPKPRRGRPPASDHHVQAHGASRSRLLLDFHFATITFCDTPANTERDVADPLDQAIENALNREVRHHRPSKFAQNVRQFLFDHDTPQLGLPRRDLAAGG
jgi:hypothetical protein